MVFTNVQPVTTSSEGRALELCALRGRSWLSNPRRRRSIECARQQALHPEGLSTHPRNYRGSPRSRGDRTCRVPSARK